MPHYAHSKHRDSGKQERLPPVRSSAPGKLRIDKCPLWRSTFIGVHPGALGESAAWLGSVIQAKGPSDGSQMGPCIRFFSHGLPLRMKATRQPILLRHQHRSSHRASAHRDRSRCQSSAVDPYQTRQPDCNRSGPLSRQRCK